MDKADNLKKKWLAEDYQAKNNKETVVSINLEKWKEWELQSFFLDWTWDNVKVVVVKLFKSQDYFKLQMFQMNLPSKVKKKLLAIYLIR